MGYFFQNLVLTAGIRCQVEQSGDRGTKRYMNKGEGHGGVRDGEGTEARRAEEDAGCAAGRHALAENNKPGGRGQRQGGTRGTPKGCGVTKRGTVETDRANTAKGTARRAGGAEGRTGGASRQGNAELGKWERGREGMREGRGGGGAR